jgi:hypothetical protein
MEKPVLLLLLLTARAMTPVMIPVLIAVIRYGDPKANSDTVGGFNPFFRCPICTKQTNATFHLISFLKIKIMVFL